MNDIIIEEFANKNLSGEPEHTYFNSSDRKPISDWLFYMVEKEEISSREYALIINKLESTGWLPNHVVRTLQDRVNESYIKEKIALTKSDLTNRYEKKIRKRLDKLEKKERINRITKYVKTCPNPEPWRVWVGNWTSMFHTYRLIDPKQALGKVRYYWCRMVYRFSKKDENGWAVIE